MTALVASRNGSQNLFPAPAPTPSTIPSQGRSDIGLSVKLFHIACVAGVIRAISKDLNFGLNDDFVEVSLPTMDKNKELLFYKISKKEELLKNDKFREAAKRCRRIQSTDEEWPGVIDQIREHKKTGHQICIYGGEQEIAELNAQEIYKRVLESVEQIFNESKSFNVSELKKRIYKFHETDNVDITATPIVLAHIARGIEPTLKKYLKNIDPKEISPLDKPHLWEWTPGLKVCLMEEFKDPSFPVLLDS